LLSAKRNAAAPDAERVRLQKRGADLCLRFLQQIHAGSAGPWLELDLSMPQLKTLLVVDWLGPVPMSRVAARLGISDSAATAQVDRLVEHGLARREHDQRDRRVVQVASTAAGRALLVRLRTAGSERLALVLKHLSTPDLERFADLMEAANLAAESEFRVDGAVPAEIEAAGRGGT
jgi:DNA-binding MarR family transcriptional regulator